MADEIHVSTVPAAKASLVALMKAETGLAGVTVDYGDPGPARLQREHIWLGDAVQADDSWAPYGRLQRDEKYSLELFVHVLVPGGTQRDATERAYALFGVITTMTRPLARTATQVCADLVQGGIAVRPTGHREMVLDEGFGAFLTGLFDLHARI